MGFCIGSVNDVMSPEVFEVEEDWSSACMSVRKRCVLDLTSITYARVLIGLRLCWKCLWVSWTCFGSRVGAICQLSASTWTHFGVPWRALECFGGSCVPPDSVLGLAWGGFGGSWDVLRAVLRWPQDVFRSPGAVLEGISHSALDFWCFVRVSGTDFRSIFYWKLIQFQ